MGFFDKLRGEQPAEADAFGGTVRPATEAEATPMPGAAPVQPSAVPARPDVPGLDAFGPFTSGSVSVVNLSGGDLSDIPEEKKEKLRQLGIDLEAIAGAAAIAPLVAADDGPDDQLERLERLAALRERGVLTDAEFQDQKQRILGT